MENIDYSRCPICHGPNSCSMVNSKNQETMPEQCWCMDMEIAREILDSLNQDFDKACICKTCATRVSSPKRI